MITAYTSSTLSDSQAQVAEKNIPWITITDHYFDISYPNEYAISAIPTMAAIDCLSGEIIDRTSGYSSGWYEYYLPTLDWSPAAPI